MSCDFKASTEAEGLGIHPDKTKILRNQDNQDNVKEKEITVDNNKIEFLIKVKVRGILDKKTRSKIRKQRRSKNRLKAAWAAFHKYPSGVDLERLPTVSQTPPFSTWSSLLR